MRMVLAVVAVCAALMPMGASAAEKTLGRDGASNVFVWRDEDAFSEAVRLMDAGVHQRNPSLLMPLLSCIVPVGTKAVVTDGGFFSSTILVTDGRHSGCRGLITNEDLRF